MKCNLRGLLLEAGRVVSLVAVRLEGVPPGPRHVGELVTTLIVEQTGEAHVPQAQLAAEGELLVGEGAPHEHGRITNLYLADRQRSVTVAVLEGVGELPPAAQRIALNVTLPRVDDDRRQRVTTEVRAEFDKLVVEGRAAERQIEGVILLEKRRTAHHQLESGVPNATEVLEAAQRASD